MAHFRARSRVLWPGFVVALLYALSVVGRSTLSFPFLRTLIRCEYPTPESFNRDSEDWSGSSMCNDTDTVINQAQVLRGVTQGLDIALQCVALPVFGHVADVYGRKAVVMVAFYGLTISGALMAIAAASKDFWPFLLGNIVQGMLFLTRESAC